MFLENVGGSQRTHAESLCSEAAALNTAPQCSPELNQLTNSLDQKPMNVVWDIMNQSKHWSFEM